MMPASSTSAMDRARDALRSLHARDGVVGALLATRDGISLLHEGGSFGNVESFAAMQATALGAAEVALQSMAAKKAVGLVIDVGERRVLARAVTEDLLVCIMVGANVPIEQAFGWMDEAGAAMR